MKFKFQTCLSRCWFTVKLVIVIVEYDANLVIIVVSFVTIVFDINVV